MYSANRPNTEPAPINEAAAASGVAQPAAGTRVHGGHQLKVSRERYLLNGP